MTDLMDWDELADSLSAAREHQYEQIGYTGGFTARLGNGNTLNPVVRVPNKPGYVYVYREVDGSNEIIQVYDADGMIPYNNESAGMVVFCGYRPGESQRTGADPVIYSLGTSGGGALNYFGGITPNQLESLYQHFIMPDRWGWMHLIPDGGFQLQLPGGWGRHGNTRVKVPKQVFADVASYKPSGSNEARYISCSINVLTGAKTITAGDIFSSDGTVNHHINDIYMPVEVPQDETHLGWVFLHSNTTKIKREHIHWAPDIFYIPPVGGGVETFYVLAGTDDVYVGTDRVIAGGS